MNKAWRLVGASILLMAVHVLSLAQETTRRRGSTTPAETQPLTSKQAAEREAEIATIRERRAAEEKDFARRKAEGEAQQKSVADELAATQTTKDGKLKVGGVSLKHRQLFLDVYDEEFVRLSTTMSFELRPYIMYTGLIQGYADLCPQSLSNDKVTVEIQAKRYVGSDFAPIMRTNYYEQYVVGRVSMEPRFAATYRDSPGKLMKVYLETWRLSSPDGELLPGLLHLGTVGVELAKDSRAMIKESGCGNVAVIKFMDNLTTYVNDTWAAAKNGALMWGQNNPLNVHPLVRYGKDNPLPQSVKDAIQSRRFSIFHCSYFINKNMSAIEYYWKANEPQPSADVLAYYDMVRPPVAECPAKVPPELKR